MARPNLEQRRERVAALLEAGIIIRSEERAALALEYGCSPGAIANDVIWLTTVRPWGTIYIGPRVRRLVVERDAGRCQYCAVSAGELIVEHVIPATWDGPARAYNLVLACQSCNSRKRRRVWIPRNLDAITVDHPEWRARILRLAEEQHARATEG